MLTGMLLNKYYIKKRIGGGAFGDVYLCDEVMNEKVLRRAAVKVIKTEAMSKEEVEDQFNDCTFPAFMLDRSTNFEAKRHIVQIYDWGFQNFEGVEKAIIVMEYVNKPIPLASVISRNISIGKFPLESEVIDYFRQILLGLSIAHELNIVHRDLHPGNILLSEGNIKLVDFGLAMEVKDIANASGGSILYSAPENFGMFCTLGSDIYSIGLDMYEFWTNYHPFRELENELKYRENANIFNRFESRAQWNYIKGEDVDKRVKASAKLDRILKKCLESDINKRYQSASEVLDDLDSTVIHLFENLNQKGEDFYTNGNYIEAKECFLNAKKEHKKQDITLGDINLKLAKCCMKLNDYDSALAFFKDIELLDNKVNIYFGENKKRYDLFMLIAECYDAVNFSSMAMIYKRKADQRGGQ